MSLDPVALYTLGHKIPNTFPSVKPSGMSISGPLHEGGYQPADAWADASLRNRENAKEEPRSMTPGDFLEILHRHKHPRWPTIGVVRTRFGASPRGDAGFGDHGTIYVANDLERRSLFAIPCNSIPYSTIRTATWNEEKARFDSGRLVRGWRSAIRDLVKASYLSPSDELSWLIGEDTFKVAPLIYTR